VRQTVEVSCTRVRYLLLLAAAAALGRLTLLSRSEYTEAYALRKRRIGALEFLFDQRSISRIAGRGTEDDVDPMKAIAFASTFIYVSIMQSTENNSSNTGQSNRQSKDR